MENIFVEFLPPWIETGLQPAFYDKESGTVLQQTARMYARVNMLIRMFNKLSKNTKTTVEDYINRFNELYTYVHDYFDNLDVQEEINNKLDDMVEQGTLQEIIATYIQSNVAWTFDSVAEMKLANNLTDGSYARTLGFYDAYDGGGSLYKITDEGSADESTIIELDSGLLANLVPEKTMGSAQFGLVGDGITDDSDNFRCMTEYAYNNKCDIKMKANSTFKVTKTIAVFSGLNLDLNGSTITSSNKHLFFNFKSAGTGYSEEDTYLAYNGNGNIEIHNGTITHTAMSFIHGDNIYLHDLNFYDTDNDHYLEICACSNFVVRNCKFIGMITQSESREYVEYVQLDKCDATSFPWLTSTNPTFDETPNDQVTIDGCYFDTGSGGYNNLYTAIGSHAVTLTPNTNITITNNIIKNAKSVHSAIKLKNVECGIVERNKLYDCTCRGIMVESTGVDIIIKDNYVEYSDKTGVLINQYLNTDQTRNSNIKIYNNILVGTGYYINVENTDNVELIGNSANKVSGAGIKFNNSTSITCLNNNNTSGTVNQKSCIFENSEDVTINKFDDYAIVTTKDMDLDTETSDSFVPDLPYTLFNQMKIEIGSNSGGQIFTLPIECFRSDTFQIGNIRKRTVFYNGIQFYLQVEFKEDNEVAVSILNQSSSGKLYIRSFAFRKVSFF